jgi:hypothetical protein
LGASLKDIGKIIAQALQSVPVLTEGGKAAVEAVQLRTRLGRGVQEEEGASQPLPKLKPKTKKNRKRLAKEGKLTGLGATPGKSNLTRTGQLLESLGFRVGKGHLEINLTNAEAKRKAE